MRLFRRRDPITGLLQTLERRDFVADTQGRLIDVAVNDRIRAVNALVEIDNPAAEAGVVRALADADARVRSAALEGLIAGRRAVVAVAHVGAIVEDDQRDALGPDDEHLVRRMLAGSVNGEVEHELAGRVLPLLESADASRRHRAQQVLALLPHAGFEVLVEALADPRRRTHAAAALGELRDMRAVPALIDLLERDDSAARVDAAQALGAIRDPRAAEPLIRAATDSDPDVREKAQEALDRLGMMGVLVGVAQLVQPLVDRVDQLERDVASRPELPTGSVDFEAEGA